MLDAVGFALFAKQCESWGLPESAARLEWETDELIAAFWRDQARVALEAYALHRVRSTDAEAS